MSHTELLAVDLFSGAGGLSLGVTQTGKVKVIAAVENNKHAQKTYKRNHPGVEVFGDITKLDFDQVMSKCNGARVNLVFGGPPCQGFSNANRQKTELISTNNQLVKEYVRAIRELGPDAFILENVKMLKSPKHKFFVSLDDKEEGLNQLGVKTVLEKIQIGKTNYLTKELINLLQMEQDLECYLIKDKILLSKLSHITRKEKESHKFILRGQSLFKKYYSDWANLHSKYWNQDYHHLWMNVRNQLKGEEQDTTKLIENLKIILECQKIIQRMKEIRTNKIRVFDFDKDNKYLNILVKSYGVLEYLIATFKDLGYKLNEDRLVLNAAQFGAPQFRERLFLIGIKDTEEKVELPLPIFEGNYYKVKDAIEDLENLEITTELEDDVPQARPILHEKNRLLHYLHEGTDFVQNNVNTNSSPVVLERFKALEQGQNFHKLDPSLKGTYSDPTRTQNTVYLKLDYDEPSGTVLNVRKSMWVHPTKSRALTIREAARLQTFPDKFIFEGPKDSQYQQIGNAVPPLLGRAVAEKVLDYLHLQVDTKLEDIIKDKSVLSV